MKSSILKSSKFSHLFFAALTLAAITFSLAVRAQAQTESVLFSFGDNSGGYGPGTLSADSSGNLYGTGTVGNGMVYQMTSSSSGWKEAPIHMFTGGADGSSPSSAVVFDSHGNLYGATSFGGTSASCPTSGCSGVVYELSPPTTGKVWKVTVLHVFAGGAGGAYPIGIVFDASGNIYGMTQGGGNMTGICANDGGCGTVFRLSPKSGGGWQFARLHSFSGPDGLLPQGNLLLDAAGNLYGSTSWGGNATDCTSDNLGGCGVVFRLSPTSTGGWTETPLHRFADLADGASPGSQIVFDAAGNLYGVTNVGRSTAQFGVAFELTPSTGGGWTLVPLHDFNAATDGRGTVGLTIDGAGNLYGLTTFGGGVCNCGTLYKLYPGTGGWTFDVVHTFTGETTDGEYPLGNLLLNSSGNLLGVTNQGGAYDGGTLFEVAP